MLSEGKVEVVHGLNVGEIVIVDPVSSLSDGLPVRIAEDGPVSSNNGVKKQG